MELKWGSKSLRSPFQNQLCDHFDCSEAACALRHAIWTEKAPKSALIPEKRVLSIVATKQLDVLRSIAFYPRKTAFSIVRQHRRWVHCLPCQLKQTPSRAGYKHERFELRLRRIFCSDLGSLLTPNSPGSKGLARQWGPMEANWGPNAIR